MKVCPTCQIEYQDTVDFCPADGMKLRTRRDPTSEIDPLIGTVLDGRWIIEEKIGEGGMGAVYKGHQKSVNRKVAVKTLRPVLIDSDEFVDRFFREARIATRFTHPNCVTILDFGQAEESDILYLAMEYLEGMPLSDRMAAGGLTVEEIVKIGIQISSALAAAHGVSIVHRDLKPDNIFLIDIGGQIHAKVLDFGIAKALDSKTQVTKTGMIFGTPEYMSPEQCRGSDIDGRSDLYSLGCILYELIGGRTPFSATTPMAILLAHVNDQAAELQSVSSTVVPSSLNGLVMKLLSKNPDHRFDNAFDVQTALEIELSNLDHPRATIEASVEPIVSGFESTYAAPGPTDEMIERHSQEHDVVPKKSNSGLVAGIVFLLIATSLGLLFALNPALLGADDSAPDKKLTIEANINEKGSFVKIKSVEDPKQEVEVAKVVEPVAKDEAGEDNVKTGATNDKPNEEEVVEKEEKEEVLEVKTESKKSSKKKTQKKKSTKEKKPAEVVVEKIEKKAEKKIDEQVDETAKKVEKKVDKEAKKAGKQLNDALDSLMKP